VGADNPVHIRSALRRARLKEHRSGSTYGHVLLLLDACAYLFAALSAVSLPAAIASGNAVILVSWISQTFLQLVLLSVIIVGQNVLAASSDKRAEATYTDADAVLHEAVKIQEHLAAQDKVLDGLVDKLATKSA
jgi:hypothetical protein